MTVIEVTINGHPVKIITISTPRCQDEVFRQFFLRDQKFEFEIMMDNLTQETIDMLRAMEIQDDQRT